MKKKMRANQFIATTYTNYPSSCLLSHVVMIPYEIYPVEAVVYLLVAINKKCTRTSTEYVKSVSLCSWFISPCLCLHTHKDQQVCLYICVYIVA